MTSVYLTPATVEFNDGVVTGTAPPGGLHDSNDSSYTMLTAGEGIRCTFSDLSLPSGAKVRYLLGVLRAQSTTAFPSQVLMSVEVPGASGGWGATIGQTIQSMFGAGLGQTMGTEAVLTDAQVDDLEIQVAANTGQIYLVELTCVCNYWTQPTVDVVSPTGTVTDSDNPTIVWSRVWDADATDKKYYVKIFTAAQVAAGGFDPDTDDAVIGSTATDGDPVTGFAASWDVSEANSDLPDGNYYAYVKVGDTPSPGVTQWSDWDSSAFTIDVARPAVPSVTLTPQDSSGRVKIEATAVGGDVSADDIQIQRRSDPDDEWVNVRTLRADGLVYPGDDDIAVAYDYEAPNGDPTYIRARAIHEYTDTSARSDWSSPVNATWGAVEWWIKHPFNTQLNSKVVVRSAPSKTRAARQGINVPLGRQDPVVVSDARQLWTGEMDFRSATDTARYYLEALVMDGTPLLLQAPRDAYFEDMWFVPGDLTQNRVIETGYNSYTFDSLPWVQVARPEGELQEFPDAAPPDEPGDDLILL